MRIVTEKYKVYKFQELSDDSKDSAIKEWYDNEYYMELENDLNEELTQLDKHGIFSDITLAYSMSNSQGDGLNFKASVDFGKFIQRLSQVKIGGMRLRAVIAYVHNVFSMGNAGFYSYAHKRQIDWNHNYQDKSLKRLERHIHAIIDEIGAYYVDICKKLEKYGYGIVDYRMNNEEFSEHCEANDYEFLEEGEMF